MSRSPSHVFPFPRSRQVVVDAARFARHRPTIRGLIEVDVTSARERLRQHHAATGETRSFTAFIASCLAHAVDADRSLHAYRDGRGRIVVFDDVDVGVIVEVTAQGRSFPLAHILRAANRRSLRELHDELRAVQAHPGASPSGRQARLADLFLRLPGPVRRAVYSWVSRHPHVWKARFGTVGLTCLGMFGPGGGWGLALPVHTLSVTVGGIGEKPAVVDGRIVPRELLSLTLDFDHDLVDGAPAARFARDLRERLERAEGLENLAGATTRSEMEAV
ncbi:pyruvate/2-oxoglutarate dehydrogenase complex dihydrolipoamide acyltransferase (E2) component [Deinococcus budaensis]|uniref:Pyruvate/2-oxoglutarate dehydrogenase complex dihydrolipoamide acyltransferase (E2) component n=1 Tax=Deinococcus budaensis TaxID=1665626 RepID=A0A7W8GFH9_9DEIO|nr:2-oxo acid dehydrogenase subunit E2 [Deinococcus budaensis]MBB5234701.1 pyruvate/2-oxoglutarate dehydrogenase complex dihydrolipoamide acyltransferase (E2) component [Deinococcus budaensis]